MAVKTDEERTRRAKRLLREANRLIEPMAREQPDLMDEAEDDIDEAIEIIDELEFDAEGHLAWRREFEEEGPEPAGGTESPTLELGEEGRL